MASTTQVSAKEAKAKALKEQREKARKEQSERKQAALEKAREKAKQLLKQGKRLQKRKVWTSIRFRRPNTQVLPKAPKYVKIARSSVNRGFDKYKVLGAPITNEAIMKLIEDQNTLVFNVDIASNKRTVRKAFQDMYKSKVESVRTLITPRGAKRAFIKLPKETEAVEVASKVGIV